MNTTLNYIPQLEKFQKGSVWHEPHPHMHLSYDIYVTYHVTCLTSSSILLSKAQACCRKLAADITLCVGVSLLSECIQQPCLILRVRPSTWQSKSQNCCTQIQPSQNTFAAEHPSSPRPHRTPAFTVQNTKPKRCSSLPKPSAAATHSQDTQLKFRPGFCCTCFTRSNVACRTPVGTVCCVLYPGGAAACSSWLNRLSLPVGLWQG